ncbi:TadE/TadG family type IV pilus assembly protein [Hoeflea prorocentri]|uniref:Pilus assembly protein n=1 Tax=Hoeflea prorocentri TaxID=1922333 RepID=A0A9X3UQA4_9HYPH|nr:pilus assembly protein [Hoeflea prorocentri]MCY6383226.1 pilus assembly protein [Hoeflea prorocentri]MDA5401026.1 pilus assembly protein [Hoeflea prorocentri]
MGKKKLSALGRKFQRDENGNFLMMFGLATAAIFLTIGLSVEYAQSINMKTRVTNSLDAATLATARALSIGDITEAQAENYLEAVFIANIGVDNIDASRFKLDDVTVDPVANTVSAKASFDQDLRFISVGTSSDKQVVGSQSGATYGISDIEVAMVLDITGSMGGSKIVALRQAANLGIEELLSVNTPNDTKVRISVVPYSYAVNVGSDLSKYVYLDFPYRRSPAPAFSSALYDQTGTGYDVSEFLEYGNINHLNPRDGYADDHCATDRKRANRGGTNYQYTDANPGSAMIPRDSRLNTSWCPSAALMPLSDDETALKNRVNSLGASGWTAGQIGLQWAWYMLSPKWADYLPAGSKPGDPIADDDLQKYIILMTDGQFNTAYADVRRRNWRAGSQGSTSRTHTDNLCDNVKSNKIKIFTIGFQLYNSTALNMLKDCATPDEGDVTYHYEPETASELKETYEDIARTIQTLRLIN